MLSPPRDGNGNSIQEKFTKIRLKRFMEDPNTEVLKKSLSRNLKAFSHPDSSIQLVIQGITEILILSYFVEFIS